ncbi:MAG TPA: fumarylacetoacetate hydrolase family protein [Streptosporangiaceae bacterium]|nr:fumarylacetoacetate hydrolase family protein [Streptosporangiaceae bacterium]
MKLITFTHPGSGSAPRAGILQGPLVIDPFAALYASYGGGMDAARRASAEAPRDMVALLAAGALTSGALQRALEVAEQSAQAGDHLAGPDGEAAVLPGAEVRLLAPVPRPPRIRDYLTYEAHATGAGKQLPPAFDEMPICYKCNVDTVLGPEDEIVWPAYSDQLDYELEVGFFVSRPGRNLSVAEAASAIAGVTIFNDVSARDIQIREMSLGIGPSKGKDFCSPMGPCIVTMDEIDEWNIELTARVNGETWSKGTTASRKYSFAEVLAWASYCEDIQPGEFLAVGTVGGGCGFELERWIRPGDVVELSSPQIGTLRNVVGHPEQVPPDAGIPSYRGAPRASAKTR